MKKYDIVLASIPRSDPRAPYPTPFILKSIIEKNGFTCKTFDWNRDLYDREENKEIFDRGDVVFNSETLFNEYWNNSLKDVCCDWVEELKLCDPTWFGISIISQRNVHMAFSMLRMVREKLPHIKIVVGGFSVSINCDEIVNLLRKHSLVDHIIAGEGEESIVQLLKGNTSYTGIDTSEYGLVDINDIPIPDYSDITDKEYEHFYNYTSRGCLNRCKFCSEPKYLKKYRYRDHKLIVDEMTNVFNTFGIKKFYFVDSLINGNPKEFRRLLKLLSHKRFNWGGMFLCSNWMDDDDYKDMSNAGLKHISVGFETGLDRIRHEMGKPFNNKTIFKTMELTLKYGILVNPLMMIGWPTETEEDFQETLDFMTRISEYENIISVYAGSTVTLTPTHEAYHLYKVKIDENGHWYIGKNNFNLRKERWFRFVDHCRNIGLNVDDKHLMKMKGDISDVI